MAGLADWAGTVEFDLTWSLGPKTRAWWATLEQSEKFCCTDSPETSPALCPRWLLVGRHEGPDPSTADQCNLLSGREQVPLIVCSPK